MKGSSGGSPSSLGSTSPVTSPHRQGSSQHRNSIDAVFVDLDLSKAGDFGLQIGDVDLRALAKDRQKKDNHNMSNQTLKKIFLLLIIASYSPRNGTGGNAVVCICLVKD